MTLRYIIQRRLDLYVYDISFIIMWAIQVVQSNLILLGEQMTCDYQNVLMFEANCCYFYLHIMLDNIALSMHHDHDVLITVIK